MIPLEDTVADIVGKAQRGLGITDGELTEHARINAEELKKLRRGHYDELVLWRVAPVLKLAGRALVDLVDPSYGSNAKEIDGLAMFNTPFKDVTVNAYLVWDPRSRDAIAFDTGSDCSAMLKKIESEKLAVRLILLTHAHADHVADLKKLRDATRAPIYISANESTPGAEPIAEGQHFECGKLRIESLLTCGHSAGGMTYFVRGLKKPLAIVGDSIFAGSMGGGNVSYKDALQNNLEKILTLPEETIICPGHGPLTTVADEKAHNPFFAHRFAE
jgi:glyoxylase-like metal-dependent hydrolase (beta-lactamase superfamily II)